jgi:hypothetical protein
MLHWRNQPFGKEPVVNLALSLPKYCHERLASILPNPTLPSVARTHKAPRHFITKYYALSHLARIGVIAIFGKAMRHISCY